MFKYDKKLTIKYYSIKSRISDPDEQTLALVNQAGIKGKNVLDFGCGDGRYSEYFISKRAAKVVGVDVSKDMIIAAKQQFKNSNVSFIKIRDGRLPLTSQSLDVVFSNFVIHYIKNTKRNFKEISRVMKKGASFIFIANLFTLFDKKLENTQIPIVLDKKLDIKILVKTEEGIAADLSSAGLKVIKRIRIPNPVAKIKDLYKNKASVRIKTILLLVKKI